MHLGITVIIVIIIIIIYSKYINTPPFDWSTELAMLFCVRLLAVMYQCGQIVLPFVLTNV